MEWQYWGKVDGDDEDRWQPLALDEERENKPNDVIALKKPKGAIEEKDIQGRNSRWICAYKKTVDPTADPFTQDQIALRINPNAGADPKCPPDAATATASPAAEAMANTTPLVLDNVFFPLGKEPRQFDAFYLGCQEAFSKKDAKVQLCFEIADSNFSQFASLRTGALANPLLAGVAADGHLHLLAFDEARGILSRYNNREPLRPPSPGAKGEAVADPPVTLDRSPQFRAAMWTVANDIFIAVTSEGTVWTWREATAAPAESGWRSLGIVGQLDPKMPIEGLVYLADGAAGQLFALRASKLYVRDLMDSSSTWKEVITRERNPNAPTIITWKKIVPIGVEGGDLGSGTFAEGLVGVGENEALYAVTFSGNPLVGDCIKLLNAVATDVAPAAVRRRLDHRLVAVAVGKDQEKRKILGFLSEPSTSLPRTFVEEVIDDDTELRWPTVLGDAIDVNLSGDQLTFVLCSEIDAQSTGLTAWAPFDPSHPAVLFSTMIPAQIGIASGRRRSCLSTSSCRQQRTRSSLLRSTSTDGRPWSHRWEPSSSSMRRPIRWCCMIPWLSWLITAARLRIS